MKKFLSIVSFCLLSTIYAQAQFPSTAGQTFFVCNATGTQNGVKAFDDGKGGTYSFWIDKRNGNAGTAVYGQHLDSLGNILWGNNGKDLADASEREIWVMDAVKWQSGFLVTWVQGFFGRGGDTLFCNYFNTDGVSQWAQPALVANTHGNIIYVGLNSLNVYPTQTGATFTYMLTFSGGSDNFSFNKIDFSGNVKYPLDSVIYSGGGSYYITASDNHDGFYAAASTGGLGSPINVSHFDDKGALTTSSPANVSTVAGGRGNDQWRIVCDKAGNAFIVWDDYSTGDLHIAKVRHDGTLPWSNGGAKTICAAGGAQAYPSATIANDTIYAIWDDGRPGAHNYDIYMQKLDTNGHAFWVNDGIQLCNLSSYIPYPSIIKTGTSVVATYLVNNTFMAQKIQPDSTALWPQNGVAVNSTNDVPFYGDYALVSTGNGNVVAVWSTSDNICATRVRPDGTLTGLQEAKQNALGIYPNPATNQFIIQLNQDKPSPVTVSIYNLMGELVAQKNFVQSNNPCPFNTQNLPAGIYLVKVAGENYQAESKICVMKN